MILRAVVTLAQWSALGAALVAIYLLTDGTHLVQRLTLPGVIH